MGNGFGAEGWELPGQKKASLVARCPTRRRSSRNQALGWDGGWEGVRTGSYPYSAFAPNPLLGKDCPCPLLALARPHFFVLLLLLYLSAFPSLALTFHFPVPSAARGSVLSPPRDPKPQAGPQEGSAPGWRGGWEPSVGCSSGAGGGTGGVPRRPTAQGGTALSRAAPAELCRC